MRVVTCLIGTGALSTRAGAESAPAEVDAELEITAGPTELDPGETSALHIRLGNTGSFGIDSAGVAVRLPPELVLISSVPSRGTYDAETGEWTTGEVLSFDSAELVVAVRAEGDGGSATVVAEVMSIDASFSSPDRDSIPGNGEPCEDDYATATLFISGDGGVGEEGPIDAGPDCASAPDAAPIPDNDADPGASDPDAGPGDDRGSETGCGCSGARGRPTFDAVLFFLVAAFASRTLLGRRRRPGCRGAG